MSTKPSKLLSPEEIADIKINPLHVHLYDAWLIVNTIAALEADNAAWLRTAQDCLATMNDVDDSVAPCALVRMEERLRIEIRVTHPGADLLSEHAKALEDGKAERDRLHEALMESERWGIVGRTAEEALRPYAKPEGEEFKVVLAKALVRTRNEGLEEAATRASGYIRAADDGVPLNPLADAVEEIIHSMMEPIE